MPDERDTGFLSASEMLKKRHDYEKAKEEQEAQQEEESRKAEEKQKAQAEKHDTINPILLVWMKLHPELSSVLNKGGVIQIDKNIFPPGFRSYAGLASLGEYLVSQYGCTYSVVMSQWDQDATGIEIIKPVEFEVGEWMRSNQDSLQSSLLEYGQATIHSYEMPRTSNQREALKVVQKYFEARNYEVFVYKDYYSICIVPKISEEAVASLGENPAPQEWYQLYKAKISNEIRSHNEYQISLSELPASFRVNNAREIIEFINKQQGLNAMSSQGKLLIFR